MDEKEKGTLLAMVMPSYRQAYSDRTAWIMACLSEFAYFKYDPLFSSDKLKKYFLNQVTDLIDDSKKGSLLTLIDLLTVDHDAELLKLKNEVSALKLELAIDPPFHIPSTDTQAILVKSDKFLVLAFRGTEAMKFSDIKTDVDAVTTECPSGGRVHLGFHKAYESISGEIEKTLASKEYENLPLMITGHSLGGALATIAAKRLKHKGGIAACYTFGSPRVGDENWIWKNMKTPVYRLVNAADSVTMLPPGDGVVVSLGWLISFIPKIGKRLRRKLLSYKGYIHCGNMRYLSDCPKGKYTNVKLLYSVSFIYRIKALINNVRSIKSFVSDHSICVYRDKLATIAIKRNP